MNNFKEFWKALVGPANWTRTKSADLKVGDKVQGSMGYSKIRNIRRLFPKEKNDPIGIIYRVFLDDGRVFSLVEVESLTISRTKDEFE